MKVNRPDLYILTDARGFTTAIHEWGCAKEEVERLALQSPLSVHGWERNRGVQTREAWRLFGTAQWDGATRGDPI